MREQKKTLVYNKIDSLVMNNPYVIIAQYSKSSKAIDQLKNLSQFYIPKNSICKLYIKKNFGKDHVSLNLFEGPIFILALKNLDEIKKISSIIKNAELKIYGGFFEETFLHFADYKMFIELSINQNSIKDKYQSLIWNQLASLNRVSILSHHFRFLERMKKEYNK